MNQSSPVGCPHRRTGLSTWLNRLLRLPENLALPLFLALSSFDAAAAPTDFAIHNGDTVVFLGDSITAARQYSKVIETYTLLRFPDWKVRFINAGHGGETAQSSLARLELSSKRSS
jgi:hypothetical protein